MNKDLNFEGMHGGVRREGKKGGGRRIFKRGKSRWGGDVF